MLITYQFLEMVSKSYYLRQSFKAAHVPIAGGQTQTATQLSANLSHVTESILFNSPTKTYFSFINNRWGEILWDTAPFKKYLRRLPILRVYLNFPAEDSELQAMSLHADTQVGLALGSGLSQQGDGWVELSEALRTKPRPGLR